MASLPAILAGGYIALFGQIIERLVERVAVAETMLPAALGWLVSVPVAAFSLTGLLFALLGGAVAANRLGDSRLSRRVVAASTVGLMACCGATLSLWYRGITAETWYLVASMLLPFLGAIMGVSLFRFLGRWAPFSWFERSLSGETGLIPYAVLFPLVTLTMLVFPLLVVVIFLFSLVFSSEAVSRQLEGQEAT